MLPAPAQRVYHHPGGLHHQEQPGDLRQELQGSPAPGWLRVSWRIFSLIERVMESWVTQRQRKLLQHVLPRQHQQRQSPWWREESPQLEQLHQSMVDNLPLGEYWKLLRTRIIAFLNSEPLLTDTIWFPATWQNYVSVNHGPCPPVMSTSRKTGRWRTVWWCRG